MKPLSNLDRCSNAEFERRHAAVRRLMKRDGFDCLLFYGNAGAWQNLFYMSNHYRDIVSCYLVFPLEGDPVLFTGNWGYLEASRQRSPLKDVRFGGGKSLALVREELEKRGLHKSVVGLVETDTYRMPGIPYKDMLELKERLPDASIKPATHLLEEVRRDKSEEEFELFRHGAKLSDVALLRGIETIKPGVTESDVVNAIAGASGYLHAALVSSGPMDNPVHLTMPTTPSSSRQLARGDIVLIELSKAAVLGYAGQVHVMVSIGPVNQLFKDLHRIAWETYLAITKALRTGCSAQEIVETGEIILKAGYKSANPLTHGWGLGVEPGFHVGVRNHPSYWPVPPFTFPRGTCLTIEPNACTPDMQAGSTAGAMVIVQDEGVEHLHKIPDGGLVVV